jgi:hypothetical protein
MILVIPYAVRAVSVVTGLTRHGEVLDRIVVAVAIEVVHDQ